VVDEESEEFDGKTRREEEQVVAPQEVVAEPAASPPPAAPHQASDEQVAAQPQIVPAPPQATRSAASGSAVAPISVIGFALITHNLVQNAGAAVIAGLFWFVATVVLIAILAALTVPALRMIAGGQRTAK